MLYEDAGDLPEGLAWAVRTAPGLRFLPATAWRERFRGAGLWRQRLERVAIASASSIVNAAGGVEPLRPPRVHESPSAARRGCAALEPYPVDEHGERCSS